MIAKRKVKPIKMKSSTSEVMKDINMEIRKMREDIFNLADICKSLLLRIEDIENNNNKGKAK